MRYDLSNDLDRQQAREQLRYLLERSAIISLEEVKAKRSLSQNAIFHLWVGVIADAIGEYDRESVKRDVKQLFLGTSEEYNRFTGEAVQVEAKTSKLTTEQMSDLLARMKHWAREELGIYLPSEGERGFAQMRQRYR